MKEGSEGEALPLSLSKKDAGNNANNQTTSPTLVPAPSFLTAPLSAATRTQVVGATLACIGAEVSAAATGHGTAGVEAPMADNNGGGQIPRVPKDTGAAARDKIFVCSVCNRCFGYKHVLQNHERTHTGEKPFECKECHKRFTRDHHLKTHMRLHTGEKPYHCTHCERQFVQVANLRRHLRVHTGERPYACELCTSRFSDSNQLKAHMLIHKGEKPFECNQCLGRFRRRHHLMHHKCPKDEGNLGKPRRGRRPKTAEDLEREARQLPTVVPERPKRERKPRETRRIIKVNIPPIMALGEGSCYAVASPFAPRPPPPMSPPEQTEPEDLSMHSSDNGDRQLRPASHQQPPRPSSVPLSVGAGTHQPLQMRSSRAKTPPGRDHDPGPGMARRMFLVDDGGSESEAMVEEEEEDEDEDYVDEDDDTSGSCIGRRHFRVQRRDCDDDGDDVDHEMEDEDEELLSEGVMEGDDEDSDDADDDRRAPPGRMGELVVTESENGGTLSPRSVKLEVRQHLPHHHPHHHRPHHHPHHHHPHHHPPLHHMHHLPHHPAHHLHPSMVVQHPLSVGLGAPSVRTIPTTAATVNVMGRSGGVALPQPPLRKMKEEDVMGRSGGVALPQPSLRKVKEEDILVRSGGVALPQPPLRKVKEEENGGECS